MKESKVKWHGQENYNMNCDIEELEKLGFICSSYNNDLAPSYMNKKENIQIFFFDLDSDEMKAEEKKFKYSLMKLDEHREYLKDIGQTNSFDEMIELVKKNEND
jgi:mannitol/fructose-specific phosphotransferase system IIA component (Ntr-type)